jgi:pimeloyl-ACP methyl ester carboxylesterase
VASRSQRTDSRGLTLSSLIGVRVDEHTTTIDGVPVFYRSAPQPGSVVVYLHDALTSSDDLLPFLERTGGLAPDLIGFGRSGKGGHLDYSPEGLAHFVQRFLDHLDIRSARLVGHGWGGALALLSAHERPSLVDRLALINAVPLLDGFTWPRPAQLLRRRGLGELLMGAVPRWLWARTLRGATTDPDVWTPDRLSTAWEQFDHGSQRALLRLHRAADEPHLAELGSRLGALETPVLIVWGDEDPWLGSELAGAYAAHLSRAEVEHFPGAGHWPWLEKPQVIDRVVDFLSLP